MKGKEETDDNIITVMLRNDQTLKKVSVQRESKNSQTLRFSFLDQQNKTILSFKARNRLQKDESSNKVNDPCVFDVS